MDWILSYPITICFSKLPFLLHPMCIAAPLSINFSTGVLLSAPSLEMGIARSNPFEGAYPTIQFSFTGKCSCLCCSKLQKILSTCLSPISVFPLPKMISLLFLIISRSCSQDRPILVPWSRIAFTPYHIKLYIKYNLMCWSSLYIIRKLKTYDYIL